MGIESSIGVGVISWTPMNFYRLNFHSRNESEIQLEVYWEL